MHGLALWQWYLHLGHFHLLLQTYIMKSTEANSSACSEGTFALLANGVISGKKSRRARNSCM